MKKLLGIVVLGLLLCSNVYAGLFSKKPILVCEIDGKLHTFNLKKMPMWPKKAPWPKNNWINEITDEFYKFGERWKSDNGGIRLVHYTVNRYSGVVNIWASYESFKGDSDMFTKLKTAEFYYDGTCKSAK